MKKLIYLFTLLVLLTIGSTAIAADSGFYWIDKNVTVLAFLGNRYSLNLHPVKYTTYQRQLIRLFHKRSGGGIYAFHLRGLIISKSSRRVTLKQEGYFLVKKSQIRKGYYKIKTSMKYQTMVILYNKGDKWIK
jgi:hypothetical protein